MKQLIAELANELFEIMAYDAVEVDRLNDDAYFTIEKIASILQKSTEKVTMKVYTNQESAMLE
jgi:hypothetical protein